MPTVATQLTPLTGDQPGIVQNVSATTSKSPWVYIILGIVAIAIAFWFTRSKAKVA